jgi:hypothetical protein
MTDSDEIRVESLYGARTDAPLVKLIAGPHEWIMPPAKAQAIAGMLLEAAEASISDAFLVRWIMKTVGAPREATAPVLREFRQFRELSRRQGREQEEADQAEWEARDE